ncbi:MAG: hypothetical protein GQE15_30370 [Archangiaceae bacterium]|nr:hypothetical protein [Archangiaceae bacterium]
MNVAARSAAISRGVTVFGAPGATRAPKRRLPERFTAAGSSRNHKKLALRIGSGDGVGAHRTSCSDSSRPNVVSWPAPEGST